MAGMRELLHAISGMGAMNSAMNSAMAGVAAQNTQATLTSGSYHGNILGGNTARSANKRLFHGNVEVLKVANGFVVNIAAKEGYEYVTHIAQTITEVNEIIAAQIVAFKLEDKS